MKSPPQPPPSPPQPSHLFIHRFSNKSVVSVVYDPANDSFSEKCFGKIPRGPKHWKPFEENVFSIIHEIKAAQQKLISVKFSNN